MLTALFADLPPYLKSPLLCIDLQKFLNTPFITFTVYLQENNAI
jgi:hypothetical protein